MDFIQAILNATKPGQKELTTDQMLQIDDLVNASREEQEKILAKAAYKGHVAGDLQAQQALKIKLSFDQVNQEAVKYAKKYATHLSLGGCYIHGKWTPWLESKTREEKDKIAKIIQEGYKAGKATGVKQYKKEGKYGLYPKGTIAGDLQEYFTGRKSHASMVARTEIARVQVAGSLNRYKKQGVKKILWLTFEPCSICEQFNRRVYAIDQMPSEIPVHPHCRCAAAPVPDEIPTGPAPEQPVPPGFAQPLQYMQPGTAVTHNHAAAAIKYKRQDATWPDIDTQKMAMKLTDDELEALEAYKFEDYEGLNHWLRDPKGYKADQLAQFLDLHDPAERAAATKEIMENIDRRCAGFAKQAAHMDKAIAKSSLPQDTILYRGCGPETAKDLMENKEHTALAYHSTSVDNGVCFSELFGRRSADGYKDIIVMKRKKGALGQYIDESESEVILPRGTKYKLQATHQVEELRYTNGKGEEKIITKVRYLIVEAT